MDKLSDAYYISQVLLFDSHKAFEKLVIKYQPLIRRLFLRLTLGDQSLADDLAQETFIKFYKYIHSYKATAKFSTWLYRIAYNVFLDYKKSEKGVKEELSDHLVYYRDDKMIDSKIDVEALLVVLNEEERWAISLSYLEDMTHEKIAAIMDCPLGTVKSYILRGKEKLRKHLNLTEYER